MISDRYDVLVVGGGIVGIATAMTLAQRFGVLWRCLRPKIGLRFTRPATTAV